MTCFAQIYEAQDPTAADGIPRLKHSVQQLQNFCKNEASLNAKTRAHLHSVFTLLSTLVKSYPEIFRDRGFRYTKTFAPVELISVAVLISQYMDKRPEGLLKGDIVAFREQMRSLHSDMTLNEVTWRSAWNFIDDLERYRGTTDGSTKMKKNPRLADRALAKAIQSSQEAVLDPRVKKAPPKRQTAQNVRAPTEHDAQEDAVPEPTNAFTPVGRGPTANPTAASGGSPEATDEGDEEAGRKRSHNPLMVDPPAPRPTLGRASKPAVAPISSVRWAERPVNYAPAVGRSERPIGAPPTVGNASQSALESDGSARKRAFAVPARPAEVSLISLKRARLRQGSAMTRQGQ